VDRNLHDMLLVMPNCEDVAVLAYAEETDALHGVSSTSINLPRETPVDNGTNLTLQRDRSFVSSKNTSMKLTRAPQKRCIGCYKYEVEATFTGDST